MKKQIKERMEDLTDDAVVQADSVIPLRVVTGGKGPPSDFWLKNLDIGTVFLARHKNNTQDWSMGEFCIANIVDKAVLLLVSSQPQQPPQPLWVDPARFSNKMEMVEIIRTNAFMEASMPPEEGEEENGDDPRTI